jgi:hypothetical protein
VGEVTLAGRITDSITHQPIADAEITYCCAHYASAKSDASGAWSVPVVPGEETGTLTMTKAGYAPGSAKTTAGARKFDIELTPAAHISGRIVDRESGAPLKGFVVNVQAQSGRMQFGARASSEDGSFTIVAPMLPGAYIVEIDPPLDDGKGGAEYGRSWYPGVPRAELAAPLIVSAGEHRDVELRIQKRPLYHVSGTFEVGDAQTVTIGLVSEPPNPRPVADRKHSGSGPFRIDGLGEGGYSLLAYVTDREGKPAAYAARKIEITDHSIDDLRLPMRPGISVKAVVTMAESGASPPEDISFIAAPFLPLRMPALVQPELSAEGLPPGEYWAILSVPAGYAVASVSFNDRPVDHAPVDLQAPASIVRFVLTSRPGAVTGTVRDANRNPIADTDVALLSASLPETFDRYDRRAVQAMEADSKGGFAFTDLAPGRYRVMALTGNDREHSRDLPFLRDRMQFADVIEIDFGQTVNVELHVK